MGQEQNGPQYSALEQCSAREIPAGQMVVDMYPPLFTNKTVPGLSVQRAANTAHRQPIDEHLRVHFVKRLTEVSMNDIQHLPLVQRWQNYLGDA